MIPRLHVVTDDRILARPDFFRAAGEVLESGRAKLAIHVRGPRSTGRAVFDATGALLEQARSVGAWLVVNDRIDVALAVCVPCVHLGARSLSARVTRRLLGEGATVGRSVHAAEEAEAESGHGIDYLFTGPVYRTPSHPDGAIGGLALVRDTAARSAVPIVAIGGISAEHVGEVRDNGAWGAAVIRAVWEARSPGSAVGAPLADL